MVRVLQREKQFHASHPKPSGGCFKGRRIEVKRMRSMNTATWLKEEEKKGGEKRKEFFF